MSSPNKYAEVENLPDYKLVRGMGDETSLYLYGPEIMDGGAHRKYAWINVGPEGAAMLLSDRSMPVGSARTIELESAADLRLALVAALEFLA